jgi:hypothetical protein
MIFAKLSTAKTISFGPVLDSTGAEFTTAVVGDVKICKNNGTPAALNGSATLTHKEVGMYELALTTSDISEVGVITIQLSKTTYVAPPKEINVLPALVYDSLVGGTDNLQVDTIQVSGTTQTGRDLGKNLVTGTVDTTGFAATTTEFEADDVTEATANHYNGRVIIFTSGALLNQAATISAYSLSGGRGHFTVPAMTEAPANNDTFTIY